MKPVQTLPNVRVEVAGRPLSGAYVTSLGELHVRQRLALPSQAELIFFGRGGGPLEASEIEPGASLRIALEDRPEPLFVGEVTAVELAYGGDGSLDVSVRGYDPLHRLRKRQGVKAHVRMTLQDLVRKLARELDLKAKTASRASLRRFIIQHQQSDLDLLVQEAESNGLYPIVWDDVLHLVTLEGIGRHVDLSLGETLLEARLEANGDLACRQVVAEGWDTSRIERHEAQATKPRAGSGGVAAVQVGGAGKHRLVDVIADERSQVEGFAQAELDRRVASEVTLTGLAEGDPKLRPGARVQVEGIAERYRGQYVLTSVNHTITEEAGFVSEIQTAPPRWRRRHRSAATSWGTVSRVDDPANLGRLRVNLPTYGDVETDWMSVVCPGAGRGTGLLALPDVGDRVLVLFAQGDPAEGIVLGGLYGSQGLPDDVVSLGRVASYTFSTPGGQRLELNDAKGRVRLENADGSFVELGKRSVRLHARAELTIEAPGQNINIRGRHIDFQEA